MSESKHKLRQLQNWKMRRCQITAFAEIENPTNSYWRYRAAM